MGEGCGGRRKEGWRVSVLGPNTFWSWSQREHIRVHTAHHVYTVDAEGSKLLDCTNLQKQKRPCEQLVCGLSEFLCKTQPMNLTLLSF